MAMRTLESLVALALLPLRKFDVHLVLAIGGITGRKAEVNKSQLVTIFQIDTNIVRFDIVVHKACFMKFLNYF